MPETQLEVIRGTNEQLSSKEIQRLFDIMIYGYAVTEEEVWGPNYTRMPYEDFLQVIANGQLYVAKFNNEVVGSIQVKPLTENTFVFGLLSADFNYKGNGIGRALIEQAEDHARNAGAKYMQLEILRPNGIDVPFKNVLKEWYEGMGYALESTMTFLERKPNRTEKAKLMVNPSVFDCYIKTL